MKARSRIYNNNRDTEINLDIASIPVVNIKTAKEIVP